MLISLKKWIIKSLLLSFCNLQSILIQIRAEIMSDPKARLELMGKTLEYNEHEAKMAFERMVMKYGWDK